MSVSAGYCEDDDAVYLAYQEGEVSVSTHLTNEQADALCKSLRKASRQVKRVDSGPERSN